MTLSIINKPDPDKITPIIQELGSRFGGTVDNLQFREGVILNHIDIDFTGNPRQLVDFGTALKQLFSPANIKY